MLLDISDCKFKRLFSDERLFLPIRWDGDDFSVELKTLFIYYARQLETLKEDFSLSDPIAFKSCGKLFGWISFKGVQSI